MVIHTCKYCNYSSNQKGSYDRHLNSVKHKNNTNIDIDIDISNNIIINKIDNLSKQNNHLVKQNVHLSKQTEEVIKQNDKVIQINEELRQKIEELEKSNRELKEANSQNTNKIVKEARAIKKSILTILNTNFKDTPSIDYIHEDEFRKELELEYKAKINDKDNKLFMRIFNDFKNKKLIQTLANLIIKFVKKEDQKLQSVFNIDSARGNYATKIEDFWHNDKSGLQLKKYTLDMVIRFILNVLDIYRQKLDNILKQKNRTQQDMDYIMEYQTLFIEVRSFLTNINTHKKVILFMCPELRLDQKMLDEITK
jgi:hypothetical protein